MIPYDDLVAALQAWRARQGLPVAAPAAGSGPRTAPPPPRTNPPAPPPMAVRPATPAPLPPEETHEEIEEGLEEHALIEESHYENEGDDFAMSFAKDGHNGHATGVEGDSSETMVGHDPLEPEHPELTDPALAQRSGREDW